MLWNFLNENYNFNRHTQSIIFPNRNYYGVSILPLRLQDTSAFTHKPFHRFAGARLCRFSKGLCSLRGSRIVRHRNRDRHTVRPPSAVNIENKKASAGILKGIKYVMPSNVRHFGCLYNITADVPLTGLSPFPEQNRLFKFVF